MTAHRVPGPWSGLPTIVTLLCGTCVWLPAIHAQIGPADEASSPRSLATGAVRGGAPDDTQITGYVGSRSLPRDAPRVIWKFFSKTTEDRPRQVHLTDAVVADGVVYFCDRGVPGRVFAVRAADGKALWQYAHRPGGINVKPSVDPDHVYFGSESGVTALRRGDGTVVWTHAIQHGAGEGPPIPVGDSVYVSGYDGAAYALDRYDGSVLWRHDFVQDAPLDAPRFEGERARFREVLARPNGAACDGVFFLQAVFDQSRLIAIKCATGGRVWSFQASGWIGPAPTILDDRVYIGSQDRHLYCLDLRTGAIIWRFAAPTWLASRVAVHDEKVFLPVHRGRLFQLDARTGELIQVFEPADDADRQGSVYSFPIVSDDTAYFATGEGQVYAVEVGSGRTRWKLRPSEDSELFTDPATDGHRIFVTARQSGEDRGECAVIALGTEPAAAAAGPR